MILSAALLHLKRRKLGNLRSSSCLKLDHHKTVAIIRSIVHRQAQTYTCSDEVQLQHDVHEAWQSLSGGSAGDALQPRLHYNEQQVRNAGEMVEAIHG